MKTAVCGAKEIHFSTQRHRGRGDSPSFLKARQGWPVCSNQNQSIFELPSGAIYSIHPKMPLLTELGIFLLGGFLQRYRAYGAKTKLTPERRSVTGFEPPPGDSREDYVRFGGSGLFTV